MRNKQPAIQNSLKPLVRLKECELVTLAQTVCQAFTHLHGERFFLDAPNQLTGYWCEDELKLALDQLVYNAVIYGDANTPVTLILDEVRDLVQISVHNYGTPVSFEREWGSGLTYVRDIVFAHGGTIQVESGSEKGTTFRLIIPRDARSLAGAA